MNKGKILEIVRNRYFYTLFIFLIWLGFIDHNSLTERVKMHRENEKLKDLKQTYLKNISETEEQMKAMEEKEFLEKLAREKYMMKKDNEDIYIVTE